MEDRILQVSGFGVANTATTQWNFALVALTANGRVLLSRRAGEWHDVGPKDRAARTAELPSSEGGIKATAGAE